MADQAKAAEAGVNVDSAPAPEHHHNAIETLEKTIAEEVPTEAETPQEDESKYPSGKVLAIIMPSTFIALFLVALDNLIVGTAIPAITDEFHSLQDVGWYASAYLLTAGAFQLFMGRIFTFYSVKWMFILNVIIFEVGSAICGAAPTSASFIVGRAIAGLGGCGILVGCLVVIAYCVPLRKRPLYQGAFGAIYGLSSVIGPLLGGAFTDNAKLTWRWCFYINLPIGGVALVGLFFFLNVSQPPENASLPLKTKLWKLDPIGTLFFLPAVVCLLLALQWGGTTYAWNSGRIIALLVLFCVFAIVFIGVQVWKQEDATLPPRFLKNRSIAGAFFFQFAAGASFFVMLYFLPIWFQALENVSAVESGIRTIPLVLSLVVGSILSGAAVTIFGHYVPWLYISCVFGSIGAGLITTFMVDTPSSKWIGYQFLFGFGLGMGMQLPNIVVNTVLHVSDVPTGSALMLFGMDIGGAIFSSVGNNVFNNKLVENLAPFPDLNVGNIIQGGATNLVMEVPAGEIDAVRVQYNSALVSAFDVSVAMFCVAILGVIFVEWRSIKNPVFPADEGKKTAVKDVERAESQSETEHEKVKEDVKV